MPFHDFLSDFDFADVPVDYGTDFPYSEFGDVGQNIPDLSGLDLGEFDFPDVPVDYGSDFPFAEFGRDQFPDLSFLSNEQFLDQETGNIVSGDVVAQQDPGFFQQLTQGITKWVKENPKEAIAMGIGVPAGAALMARGLLGTEPEIQTGMSPEQSRMLALIESRARGSEPAYREGLARLSQIQQGNYGPSAFEDEEAIRRRANELIMKELDLSATGQPDPELARRLEEERQKLDEYFIRQFGPGGGGDIYTRARAQFDRQAAEALEQSKLTLRGERISQAQGVSQPRAQQELSRQSDLFKNVLTGLDVTDPAKAASSGLAGLSDLARAQVYGQAANQQTARARNQAFLQAGGQLAGFGLAPTIKKLFG